MPDPGTNDFVVEGKWYAEYEGSTGVVAEAVMLEMKAGAKQAGESSGFMDFVFVLDTSGSMEGDGKLLQLKRTMTEILNVERKYLTAKDRLGIISFADEPKVVLEMKSLSTSHRNLAVERVGKLEAKGWTQMQKGLEEGIKLFSAGSPAEATKAHVRVIYLLTDGAENKGSHAAAIPFDTLDLRVEAFAFGNNANVTDTPEFKVLKSIAERSYGMYHNAQNVSKLTSTLTRPIYGHRNTVVKDVTVTLEQGPGPRMMVEPPTLKQTPLPVSSNPIKLFVPDFFSQRVVRATVNWDASPGNWTDMKVSWTYRVVPGTGELISGTPFVLKRPSTFQKRSLQVDPVPVPKKRQTEYTRLKHVVAIKEAKDLADKGSLEDAQERLAEAFNDLQDVLKLPDDQVCKKTINFLYVELEELVTRMSTPEIYLLQGLRYVLASILSHDNQRPTTRANPGTVALFSTDAMEEFLREAIEFDEQNTSTH